MKVTKEMLSIPPYISTHWDSVATLSADMSAGPHLIVTLLDDSQIRVPLAEEDITKVFTAHQAYLEHQSTGDLTMNPFDRFMDLNDGPMVGLPFRFGDRGFEGMGPGFAHDPSQAQNPDLPPEILEKIAKISEVLGTDKTTALPKPHTGCNCFHCQVARAIGGPAEEEDLEEEVGDDELTFRTWDIEQSGEALYTVTNPSPDSNEQFQVFLGKPGQAPGCTCGDKDCEHIIAVLKS